MTSRSTNTNSSWPVNRRLAYPPPPRTHDNPYDYVESPPPPPSPPRRTHDNPYDYDVSPPLTHLSPYDYFFSMYDDDTDDHWRFENPLSPLSNTFRTTQVSIHSLSLSYIYFFFPYGAKSCLIKDEEILHFW